MALGLMFAGGVILFMAVGYGIDRLIGTLPFGTVIGTLVGAVLSFLSVYRRLVSGKAKDPTERGK